MSLCVFVYLSLVLGVQSVQCGYDTNLWDRKQKETNAHVSTLHSLFEWHLFGREKGRGNGWLQRAARPDDCVACDALCECQCRVRMPL